MENFNGKNLQEVLENKKSFFDDTLYNNLKIISVRRESYLWI